MSQSNQDALQLHTIPAADDGIEQEHDQLTQQQQQQQQDDQENEMASSGCCGWFGGGSKSKKTNKTKSNMAPAVENKYTVATTPTNGNVTSDKTTENAEQHAVGRNKEISNQGTPSNTVSEGESSTTDSVVKMRSTPTRLNKNKRQKSAEDILAHPLPPKARLPHLAHQPHVASPPPISRKKIAFQEHLRNGSSEAVAPPVTSRASSTFLQQWTTAIALLRKECHLVATQQTVSPVMQAWLQSHPPFDALVTTLTTFATLANNHPSSPVAEETQANQTTPSSRRRSLARQLSDGADGGGAGEGGGLLILDAASAVAANSIVTNTPSVGGSPLATSRWSRRQTMRTQQQQQQQYHQQTQSVSHMKARSVEATPWMEAIETQEDLKTHLSDLSLALDLTTALTQQQQQLTTGHQTTETTALGTALAAPVLDPIVFRGLSQFGESMGTQLVLSHLPDLETQLRRADTATTASSSMASSSLVTTESTSRPSSSASPTTTASLTISSKQIGEWFEALVALLNQVSALVIENKPVASTQLRDASTALFQQLFPAPSSPVSIVDGLESANMPLLLLHLSSLMSLTLPLFPYYHSAERSSLSHGAPFAVQQRDGGQVHLLPPREWLLAGECSPQVIEVLLPSSSSLLPLTLTPALLKATEDEMCKIVVQLSSLTSSNISHRSARLSLVSMTSTLHKLATILAWLQEFHQRPQNELTPISIALLLKTYPFILHSLLDVFFTKLSVAHVMEGDEYAMAQLWSHWYHALEVITNSWTRMLSTLSNVNNSPMKDFYRAIRHSTIFRSPTFSWNSEPVSVPSIFQLLTSTVALLFDPMSHPLELHLSSSSGPTRTTSIPSCQRAVFGALKEVGSIVNSAPFLRWQLADQTTTNLCVDSPNASPNAESVAQQPPSASSSNPLLALIWFWDPLLPLFTPNQGCLYNWLMESAHMDLEDPDSYDLLQSRQAIELSLLSFIHQLIFTPPSSSQPYVSPWILDDTFTSTYLQLHHLLLSAYYHAPQMDDRTEQLAVAHVNVLKASASLPSIVSIRPVSLPSPDHTNDAVTPIGILQPPPSIRLSHIHYQLYHLHLVEWLSSQMSLELELGLEIEEKTKAHQSNENGVAELNQVEQEVVQDRVQSANNDDDAAYDEDNIEHHHDDEDGDGSQSGSGSDSDFSDINFEDSDEDFTVDQFQPHPAVADTFKRLEIKTTGPGNRHVNEQFALGMDGQPLHPEAMSMSVEENAFPGEEIPAEVAVEEAVPDESPLDGERLDGGEVSQGGASSSGDLGGDGWGDDSADDEPTPRPKNSAFALPSFTPMEETQPIENNLTTNEVQGDSVAAVSQPFDLPSTIQSTPASYAELRSRHLLYRSPQLHTSLLDLLLTMCLDPSSPEGYTLNQLYCSRFPLQVTEDQRKQQDRMQRLNTGGLDGGHGVDDASLSFEESLQQQEKITPIPVNVLYSLRRHVNHPANAYLCQNLERAHLTSASSSIDQIASIRAGSYRRLMKLLFESLFTPHLYVNRQQIGRGRFASVYSTQYLGRDALDLGPSDLLAPGFRYAMKQVAQPSTIHDQMFLVDLFTEISILECMKHDAALTQATTAQPCGVLDILDFGVGENSFWIIMPLAKCSLKAFKLQQEGEEEEEDTTGPKKGKKSKKQKKEEAAAAESRKQAMVDGLITSLLSPLSSPLSNVSTLPPQVRRLLSSFALYDQVLESCRRLERNHIVHFDIKADNFLVFTPATATTTTASSSSSSPSTPPLLVALADFGEAMFLSPSSISDTTTSLDHLQLEWSSLLGSRISRGTEQIQSPEMLTLIRALDAGDDAHDRRRKNEADFSSDVWSIGALFYEIVMHTYPSTTDEDDAPTVGGTGLLFEESAGLPLFLQITSDSLPILAEEKAAILARPDHLGRFFDPCHAFLTFILKRDRLQRPSLDQVRVRFKNLVKDILALI